MTQPTKPELPIGYWLKRADDLLCEQINRAQAAHGVSRAEWQAFNLLNEIGSVSKERLFESMRTFVDAPSLDEIITRFIERGWIERSRGSKQGTEEYQLTEEGRREHGAMLTAQKEVRLQAMHGISQAEYATAIRVLQRIVSNLEGASDSADQQASSTA